METVPPIQATLESSMQCQSGTRTSVAKYFRDEQSRVRLEQGGLTSIHDPVSGKSFVLNPAQKLAIPTMPKPPEMTMPKIPGMPSIPKIPSIAAPHVPGLAVPNFKETAQLPEKTIDGIKVSGKQFSADVPGKPKPLTGELWTSHDLKLPIQSSVTDPSTGCITKTQMKNVQPGVKLDPGMFQVPPGFKIAPPPIPPAK